MPSGAPGLDRAGWEARWTAAIARHGAHLAERPASTYLAEFVAGLPAGRALDAGCGHGAEAIWLAKRGWQVTGVDFAQAALAQAQSAAQQMEPHVAERLGWRHADLTTWRPEAGAYNLVVCLYVHMGGGVPATVQRLAAGVAPGGTLLCVGHQPTDPATGQPTAASDQTQVSVASGIAALPTADWDVALAEERPRPTAGSGVDAVICARRRA